TTRHRQNQRRRPSLGQVRQEPDDWADGDRRRGGVSRIQAVARNCRNQSTDAGSWGGSARISVEGPVMGLEQRGRVRWSCLAKQLETGWHRQTRQASRL